MPDNSKTDDTPRRDAYVPVRMTPALKERLRRAARREHRSMSQQAVRLIEQGLQQRQRLQKAA